MKQQPSLRRHRAYAPGLTAPGQRGAMAFIAAVGITVCFLMTGLVIMTGFVLTDAQRLRNYADAYSSAWGLQMVAVGRQDWPRQLFYTDPMAVGHGYVLGKPQLANSADIVTQRDSSDPNNRYMPAHIGLRVQAPFGMMDLASRWLPGTPAIQNLFATSRVRVNQMSLGVNTLYRQPVILMLDFSSTMRLNYTGPYGTSGERAEQALKRVAQQLIKDSAYAYNLGVMGFSTGEDSHTYFDNKPRGPSESRNPADAWYAEENRRQAMFTDVANWQADGDGTDIENAVTRARDALRNAADPTFPFQKPMMVLVTDGEPNRSRSAQTGTGQNLEQLQQLAVADAQQAVRDAWSNKINGIDASVDTLILQIQREQSDPLLGARNEDFLRSIAGHNGQVDTEGNYFHKDGGDPNQLTLILQKMPKMMYCDFGPLDQVADLTANNAVAPDANKDVLRAFVSMNGASDQELVINPNNIFFDYNAFNIWASNPNHAAYLTANDNDNQTITTKPLGGTAEGAAVLQNTDLMGLFYDPTTKHVIVSGMLCAALNLRSTNPGLNTMRVRLRWGYPQLDDPNQRY